MANNIMNTDLYAPKSFDEATEEKEVKDILKDAEDLHNY